MIRYVYGFARIATLVVLTYISPAQAQPATFEVDIEALAGQTNPPFQIDFLRAGVTHTVYLGNYIECFSQEFQFRLDENIRSDGRGDINRYKETYYSCEGMEGVKGTRIVEIRSTSPQGPFPFVPSTRQLKVDVATQIPNPVFPKNYIRFGFVGPAPNQSCTVKLGSTTLEKVQFFDGTIAYVLPDVRKMTIDAQCTHPVGRVEVAEASPTAESFVDNYKAEIWKKYGLDKLTFQQAQRWRNWVNIDGISPFPAPHAFAPVLIQRIEFTVNSNRTQLTPPVISTASKTPSQANKTFKNAICKSGSIVRTDNLSLGEKIAVTGTPFDLTYLSSRVYGRSDDRSVRIPLTEADVSGISQVKLNVKIAGQEIVQLFPPVPNQHFDFHWNGLDSSGNLFGTAQPAITVAFINIDGSVDKSTSRLEMGHWLSEFHGIGGWMLSPIHKYDVRNKRLHLGDGSTRNVAALKLNGELIIASEDGSTVYIFDQQGIHLRTRNGITGNTTYTIQYNARRRPISITDQFGNVTSIDRNSEGFPVSITAPFGQKTILSVTANNYLASVTNPKGETYEMTYGPGGLLTSFKKPNGLTTTFTYSSNGLLDRDTGAGGNFIALAQLLSGETKEVTVATAMNRRSVIELTHTDVGSNQTQTDERGLRTTLKDLGESTEIVSPEGLKELINFSQDSQYGVSAESPLSSKFSIEGTTLELFSRTDVETLLASDNDPFLLERKTTTVTFQGDETRKEVSEFLAADRSFNSVSPIGRKQTLFLNEKDLVSQSQVGDLLPVNYSYNNRGQLAQIAQGSRTTAMSYDSLGQLSAMTDSLGRSTTFQYDLAGRVISQTRPDGKSIHFNYDAAGNLISVTPPEKPLHQFSLNAFELVGSYLPPALPNALTPTTYTYNLDKQLTAINRPDGKEVNFNYNAATGVLNSIMAPDASVNFSYSPTTGQVTSLQSSDNVTSNMTYLGPLPASITNSGATNGSVSFTYDPEFRLASVAVVNGQAVAMGYDKDSLLVQIGQKSFARRLSDGLITGSTIGKISESMAYNAFGEMMSDEHKHIDQKSGHGHQKHDHKPKIKNLYKLDVVRDNLGRIVEKSEVADGDKDKMKYSYDIAGRLVSAIGPKGFRNYTYDANGNRTFMSSGSHRHGVSYSYDSQDRLIQAGDVKYRYNNNGDLMLKEGDDFEVEYFYDSLGNLKTVNFPRDIYHDPDCNRDFWRKHRHQRKDHRIDYIVDGMGRRVGKKVNGKLVQQFVWQSQLQIAAELDSKGRLVKQFVYGSKVNVPDYMIAGGRTYSIITDQLGSPRLVVDAISGKIAQEIEYDEFGNITKDTEPGFTPFGFAGGLYDRDTKLLRFGARDYDPEVGRWTSKDPIGFNGGLSNLYGYTANDPVNFLDANGASARDVERMHNIFKILIQDMIRLGQRHPTSSEKNNASRLLNDLTLGLAGKPYLGCYEQRDQARDALATQKYDDQWTFMDKGVNYLGVYTSPISGGFSMAPHHWLEAKSSNPSDPRLLIDPWKGVFVIMR